MRKFMPFVLDEEEISCRLLPARGYPGPILKAAQADPAFGHQNGVLAPGDVQDVHDGAGRLLLRVDNEVDIQVILLENLAGGIVLPAADPDDLGWDVRERPSDEGGHQVDLVGVGHGYEHLGMLEVGLLERVDARPAPTDHLGVERLGEPGDLCLVLLHEVDVDVLLDETPGDRGADLARAYDEHAHYFTRTMSAGSRPLSETFVF